MVYNDIKVTGTESDAETGLTHWLQWRKMGRQGERLDEEEEGIRIKELQKKLCESVFGNWRGGIKRKIRVWRRRDKP